MNTKSFDPDPTLKALSCCLDTSSLPTPPPPCNQVVPRSLISIEHLTPSLDPLFLVVAQGIETPSEVLGREVGLAAHLNCRAEVELVAMSRSIGKTEPFHVRSGSRLSVLITLHRLACMSAGCVTTSPESTEDASFVPSKIDAGDRTLYDSALLNKHG